LCEFLIFIAEVAPRQVNLVKLEKNHRRSSMKMQTYFGLSRLNAQDELGPKSS